MQSLRLLLMFKTYWQSVQLVLKGPESEVTVFTVRLENRVAACFEFLLLWAFACKDLLAFRVYYQNLQQQIKIVLQVVVPKHVVEVSLPVDLLVNG